MGEPIPGKAAVSIHVGDAACMAGPCHPVRVADRDLHSGFWLMPLAFFVLCKVLEGPGLTLEVWQICLRIARATCEGEFPSV